MMLVRYKGDEHRLFGGILMLDWTSNQVRYYPYELSLFATIPGKWDGKGSIFLACELVSRNYAQQLDEQTIEMQGVKFRIIGREYMIDAYAVELKRQ